MVLIIAQHDTPQSHSSWWFLFVCLNDLVELHTHRYCARNKTKRTQTIIWILFFFLPLLVLRVILSDFDRSSPFGTSIERKKKETQVIRHCGLIRLTRRPNRQVKRKKRKICNQNIPRPSNFTPSRTAERRRRAESRTTTPERLVSMPNIRPLARSTLVRLMGNEVTKSTSPPPPPSLRFFLQQKIDILSHNNNRSAIVPLREQQLRKKNNYNVNKSNNNNESNWKIVLKK